MWLLNPYWYTQQYSAPASNYLDQVIAADVAAGNLLGLEDGTKTAIATFIDNLIVDGYLGVTGGTISQASSVIKASPILAGARTLAGALVPLVGTAPTNFNFVAGDYNRKTGLMGNGSTKHLNSNRNNNADPQNSKHLATWRSTASSNNGFLVGQGNGNGDSHLYEGFSNLISRNNSTSTHLIPLPAPLGFYGHSRNSSTGFVVRNGNTNYNATDTSTTPTSGLIYAFSNGAFDYSNARLAFYSIGESLDLALLDARVTTLINAISAAIP